ncbi:MAG: ABC transporter ATP-binding protein, partial [Candidatus Omnitrophica bacterium]|nr:ABC transporter ATP-binding protein [Candidatus Omnitrophota bacterium]
DFTELGKYFDMPVRTYSTGMRARLAFALSMAFDFDYYIIDEVIVVGDTEFRKKCNTILKEKLQRSNLIIASHKINSLKDLCHIFAIPYKRDIVIFEDFKEASKFYEHACKNGGFRNI